MQSDSSLRINHGSSTTPEEITVEAVDEMLFIDYNMITSKQGRTISTIIIILLQANTTPTVLISTSYQN